MESRLWDPSESGECGERKDMQSRMQRDGYVKLKSPTRILLSARVGAWLVHVLLSDPPWDCGHLSRVGKEFPEAEYCRKEFIKSKEQR